MTTVSTKWFCRDPDGFEYEHRNEVDAREHVASRDCVLVRKTITSDVVEVAR